MIEIYKDGLTKKNYDFTHCSRYAYESAIYDLNTALALFFSPDREFTRSIVKAIKVLKITQSEERIKLIKARNQLDRNDKHAKAIMTAIFDLQTVLLSHREDSLPDWQTIVPNYDELMQINIQLPKDNKRLLLQRAFEACRQGKISKADFYNFSHRKDMQGIKL